jgi:hypothetical protein
LVFVVVISFLYVRYLNVLFFVTLLGSRPRVLDHLMRRHASHHLKSCLAASFVTLESRAISSVDSTASQAALHSKRSLSSALLDRTGLVISMGSYRWVGGSTIGS